LDARRWFFLQIFSNSSPAANCRSRHTWVATWIAAGGNEVRDGRIAEDGHFWISHLQVKVFQALSALEARPN
jgi:hypothetical protein